MGAIWKRDGICNAVSLWRSEMKAIMDLFSTGYGLFSVAVIGFTLGMAVWFKAFFTRKMNESAQQDKS
jgi:hypothetical protein